MKKSLATLAAVLFLGLGSAVADQAMDFRSYRSMSLELALALAQASLEACRKQDYQVAVAVLDRAGAVQVVLRDGLAGPQTTEMARRKAWTAISFRLDTSELAPQTQAGQPAAGIRHVGGVLMLGGGRLVRSGGELVGAIGVSGAPGGERDDFCADAAIEALDERLNPL